MQAIEGISFDIPDAGDAIVASVSNAVRGALSAGGRFMPALEAQVHRAVDMMQRDGEQGPRLRKVEAISCHLRHMRNCLESGRINGYDSQMLRLRRVVETL